MENYSFCVYEKIKPEDRDNWYLYIDAVYKADAQKKNLSAEVLSKLLGVKTQGGFRYLGSVNEPKLVVLYSTGEDIYWRDELDSSMGVFIYYGDNNKPGRDIHKTNLHGNEILRNIFELATSDNVEKREKIPPILVFKKTTGRDVKFLGLAVPGIKGKPKKDWLTAVWGCNKEGDRFQNYKAYFTILNTSSGSEFESGAGINLAWLNDIKSGQAISSKYAPLEWRRFIRLNKYASLMAKKEKYIKSKAEQLPKDLEKRKMLTYIHDYFINKDNGYSFESFSADIISYMDDAVIDVEVTRPYRDGGFDAEGKYRIFKQAENSICVDFYMQAKCYSLTNPVSVADTARLISRIKNRQFGIMITTSYIANQAYKEILEDGHPIILINGNDIIEYIFNELEIRDINTLNKWLENNY